MIFLKIAPHFASLKDFWEVTLTFNISFNIQHKIEYVQVEKVYPGEELVFTPYTWNALKIYMTKYKTFQSSKKCQNQDNIPVARDPKMRENQKNCMETREPKKLESS